MFQDLDPASIWHGNEHVQNISASNIADIDPDNKKIMQSTYGILKALEFLEDVLLKTPPDVQKMIKEHEDHESANRRLRYRRSPLDESDAEEALDEEEEEDIMDEDPDMLSLAEDPSNDTLLYKKNWHISLFGEIIQDDEDDEMMDHMHPILVNSKKVQDGHHRHHDHGEEHDQSSSHSLDQESGTGNNTAAKLTIAYRNVSELLFHPSNFQFDPSIDNRMAIEMMEKDNNNGEHFDHMMSSIHQIYKRISDKLNFWQSIVRRKSSGGGSQQSDGYDKQRIFFSECFMYERDHIQTHLMMTVHRLSFSDPAPT